MNSDFLLPLVRSRFHHEVTQLRVELEAPEQATSFEQDQLFRVFADHLALSLVEENEAVRRQVTRSELQQRSLEFDAAVAIAKQNLLANQQLLPSGVEFDVLEQHIHFPAGPIGEHNASLILFPDEFERLPLNGLPLLFLPHSAMFWVTGSKSEGAIETLAGMTLQELQSGADRPISSIPFILIDGQWQPWKPGPDHRLYGVIRELYQWQSFAHYEVQSQLLSQQFQHAGHDVHVAKYQLEEKEDRRRRRSYSIWTETVPTLLPRTDVVCLQRLLNRDELDSGRNNTPRFGERIFVEWDAFQRHCVLVSQPRHPERFAAELFPDEETLDRLRTAAINDMAAPQSQPTAKPDHPGEDSHATDSDASSRSRRSDGAILGCGVAIGCLLTGVLGCVIVAGLFLARVDFNGPQMGGGEFSFPALDGGAHLRSGRQAPTADDFDLGELSVTRQRIHQEPLVELPDLALPETAPPALPELDGDAEPSGFAGFSGMPDATTYQDQAPVGGLLVGLRLYKGRQWGGALRAIQPIYQVENRYVLGKRLGPPQAVDYIQYLAEPGFYVSAVHAQIGLDMNALQLRFEPATEAAKAGGESYHSGWFGSPGGGPYDLTGGPFVGVEVAGHEEGLNRIQLQRTAFASTELSSD